jgi:hypothetical protein
LAWGDLAEIGEDHSLNQKSLHLSSLLFLMQLPCSAKKRVSIFQCGSR